MPKISFRNNKRPSFEVPSKSNLMQALLSHDIPVASSCGGEGVCTKCIVDIVAGMENLNPPNDLEKDLVEIHDLEKKCRVSCQTEVYGDVEIDTSYW